MSPLRFNRSDNFNPLPRKEGDCPAWDLCGVWANFNPLPRKEGDTCTKEDVRMLKISIHSLVKRETGVGLHNRNPAHHFNPLPRKEGDKVDIACTSCLFISIHSLVKRETDACHNKRHPEKGDFNPLPRKEGDCSCSFSK